MDTALSEPLTLITAPQQMHFEMEDLIEQANEVQESMSRTYGVPDEVDEADLEAGELCVVVCRSSFTSKPTCTSHHLPQNSMPSATISRKREAFHRISAKTRQVSCRTLWMSRQ